MSRPERAPNVFSVPSGEPFLKSLATAILQGTLPRAGTAPPDPVGLSDYRVLLPTRRAVRSLAETFLEISDDVRLLPRMTALGDVDEDELMLGDGGSLGSGLDELTTQPAISALERRLILTRLILAWVGDPAKTPKPSVHSPAQAAQLAGDLARLIDMFDTEQADWSDLESLVDRELSRHWEGAVAFLELLRTVLPQLLEARGVVNPMARRNLLLQAQAERFQSRPEAQPVIAAGSTGSVVATAELLKVVAGLPNGAVVVPGLDMLLENTAWNVIGPDHPQYGLRQLLERIGISRSDVRVLTRERSGSPAPAREKLLSEVMRPADASERWGFEISKFTAAERDGALAGLHSISAPTQRDEALAIAMIMRRTLEDDRRRAALVTPDRTLARRVSAELARWDIAVDDSAGEPLATSAHGTFVRLLADTVIGDCEPVPLLALLKHPMTSFGREPALVRRMAGLLEMAALRGLAPRGGVAGIKRSVSARRDSAIRRRVHRNLNHVKPADWTALDAFLDRIAEILEPFSALCRSSEAVPAGLLLRAHIACAETVCAPSPDSGSDSPLWQGDAGEALASFFAALLEGEDLMPSLSATNYPAFVDTLMAGHVVRARFGLHPRLHIWGLLEARLMQTDVVILGGLTEGTWPPHAMTDAWLNRPMRTGLDLEPPERRIGLTAHDFVQAASAPEVYLTRSEKIDGSPSVASRWLHRLDALLRGMHRSADVEDGRWVSWALGMDHVQAFRPISLPKPRPPVGARPRALSVTQVETWIRDPYAIYARIILGLEPMEPLAGDPTAADRGTIIHTILHEAVRGGGPVDVERLLDAGNEIFRAYSDFSDVAAFWWPRFERIARWMIAENLFSSDDVDARFAEVKGSMIIDAAGGPFEITARADRIDLRACGTGIVIDYKTGQIPTDKQVASGLSPQLPLEAAIAMNGGFEGFGPVGIEALQYVRLSGGEPPGKVRVVATSTPRDLAGLALDGLARRIADFDREETPYLPRVAVESERQPRDYDHLARHMEWARLAVED